MPARNICPLECIYVGVSHIADIDHAGQRLHRRPDTRVDLVGLRQTDVDLLARVLNHEFDLATAARVIADELGEDPTYLLAPVHRDGADRAPIPAIRASA